MYRKKYPFPVVLENYCAGLEANAFAGLIPGFRHFLGEEPRISTYFESFQGFSRTAFRLQGLRKAIRSFFVAAQVNSYAFAASFSSSPVASQDCSTRVYFYDL